MVKYKVISTQMSFLQSFVGKVGKLQSTQQSNSLTYYCLRFDDSIAWFLEDAIKKEK